MDPQTVDTGVVSIAVVGEETKLQVPHLPVAALQADTTEADEVPYPTPPTTTSVPRGEKGPLP